MAATLRVHDKAGELVAEVTPRSFGDFKRQQPGRVALLLTLGDGDHILIDTCAVFKLVPPGCYNARLLQKVKLPRNCTGGDLRGCDAWEIG